MKKFLLTCAAAAIAMSASAYSFENRTVTPEPGVVTDISSITVTFSDYEELAINNRDGIYLMNSSGDKLQGRINLTDDSAGIEFIPVTAITNGGDYRFMISGESLCGYTDNHTVMNNCPEMTFDYTIEGSGSDFNFEGYTSEPAEGEVTSLSEIAVTFPNMPLIDINSKEDITVSFNGKEIEGTKKTCDGSVLTLNLPEVQTEAGTYVLTIGEWALGGYPEDMTDWYGDNEEAITLTWTIAGAHEDLDFSFTATPENGSAITELEKVELAFGGLDSVSVDNEELVTISYNDGTLDAANYTLTAEGNVLTIAFTPAIGTELPEDGHIAIGIKLAANALKGAKEGTEATNANPISLSYDVYNSVEYTLTLAISNPEPNENGEISANKSLMSIFFVCEQQHGLVAAAGTEANAGIKEVNGDFEAEGHLRKSNGLNQNYSYFSVDFGDEPLYNGEYKITINKGAFGTEIWGQNPELGYSNEEIELTFTLVDGETRPEGGVESILDENGEKAIFNLQGIRMNGTSNELPAGIYIVNGKKVVIR